MSDHVWAACSEREFPGSGRERHLVRVQGRRLDLVTICGHSASIPGIWRRNKAKPKCATCAASPADPEGATE